MGEFHFADIVIGFPLLMQGLLYTLGLSAASFSAAIVLGTVLALLREERRGLPGIVATAYIEFLRGIPLILFLVFMHYGLLPLVLGRSNFLLAALLAFILFESAYIAEIIRSGLRSVNISEREAARSLGLGEWQQLRLIILPLAFRRMTPALIGQLVSLIKDTSLASIVGVIELARAGEIISEQRYHDFEILLFVALVYFAVCFGLSRWGKRLETPEQQAGMNRGGTLG